MIRFPRYLISFLIATVVALVLTGCGSIGGALHVGGPRHLATVTVVTSHGILALVQDSENAMVCGKATAPVPCVTASAHKAISADLVTAWADEADVERLVRSVPAGVAVSPDVPTLLGKISGLIDKIVKAIPNSSAKTTLVTNLTGK
jgi:hypothetical protein